jgi:hypothetical protein
LLALWVLMRLVSAAPVQGTPRGNVTVPRQFHCSESWVIVPSPNSSEYDDNTLLAVSSSRPDDAWAVGFLGSGGSGFIGTLTLHWDGRSWTVVPSPDPGAFFNALFGVVAIARDDAWAVGSYSNSPSSRDRPLSMHWDGTRWSLIPVAQPPRTAMDLYGVDAAPSGSVWTVGAAAHHPSLDNRTIVELWTGAEWTILPSPTPRSGVTMLAAVSAFSPRRAWAVGLEGPINEGRTLVERWDGRRWAAVPSSNVGEGVNELAALAVRTPRDAWAVGSFQTGQETGQALVEHFDGRAWRVLATPRIRGSGSLKGVAVLPNHDVWAVGVREDQQHGARLLAEHWNGSSWEIVPMPRPPGSLGDELSGLAEDRGGGLWAVGDFREPVGGLTRTLIERRCGR